MLCILRSSSSVRIPCFCPLLRNSSSATTPQNFLFAVCLSQESSRKIILITIIIIISISQSPQFFLSLNLSRISLCRRLSLQSLCRVSLSLSSRSLGSLHLSSLCPFPTHFSIFSCDHYCRNEHLCTDDLSSIQTWVVDLGFLFVTKSSQ